MPVGAIARKTRSKPSASTIPVTAAEDACLCSKSAEYLNRSGQTRDLDFTLKHVNDLPFVYMMKDDEVVAVTDGGKGETPLTDLTHAYHY